MSTKRFHKFAMRYRPAMQDKARRGSKTTTHAQVTATYLQKTDRRKGCNVEN